MEYKGRKTVVLRLKPEIDIQLLNYAKQNKITKSDVIEQYLFDLFKIAKPLILETRGRKVKINNIETNLNKTMEFKRKISKKLYTWIFKYRKIDDEYIKLMIEYLEKCKIEIPDLSKEELLWVDQLIICLQSKSFEALPLDFKELHNKDILHMLYTRGLHQEEVKTIMGIIEGKIKIKRHYEEKIEFEKME